MCQKCVEAGIMDHEQLHKVEAMKKYKEDLKVFMSDMDLEMRVNVLVNLVCDYTIENDLDPIQVFQGFFMMHSLRTLKSNAAPLPETGSVN